MERQKHLTEKVVHIFTKEENFDIFNTVCHFDKEGYQSFFAKNPKNLP